MQTTRVLATALGMLTIGACSSHRPSAPAGEDGSRRPSSSASATAPTAQAEARGPAHGPDSKLDPLPSSKCSYEVVDPGKADGANTTLGVSYGFSPRLGGSALPVTVTWTKRFRAVYTDSATAEIEVEDRSVHLRAQAAPEDLRLVPEKPIALTPWLTIRRGTSRSTTRRRTRGSGRCG